MDHTIMFLYMEVRLGWLGNSLEYIGWTVRSITDSVTAHTWTVWSIPSGICVLGTRRFSEHVSGKLNAVTLEINSIRTLFQKMLPRPSHYDHDVLMKLCAEPISHVKALSPRPQTIWKTLNIAPCFDCQPAFPDDGSGDDAPTTLPSGHTSSP